MKTGKIRVLAVTSAERSSQAPELPTVAEAGVPCFEVTGWYGLFTPVGTPPNLMGQINAAVKGIADGRDLQKRFVAIGGNLTTSTPDEFTAFVKAEIQKWAKMAKESDMRVDGRTPHSSRTIATIRASSAILGQPPFIWRGPPPPAPGADVDIWVRALPECV